MKFIKLFIVFVLILGGIVGVMLVDCGGGTSGGVRMGFTGNLQELSDRFVQEWGDTQDWNEELFLQHERTVKRNRGDMLTEDEADRLTEQLHSLALQVIVKRMTAEFQNPNCNATVLTDNSKGLDLICDRNAAMTSEARVKHLRDCYQTYKEISAFVSSSFGLTPNLRTNSNGSHSWNDFAAYKSRQQEKAEAYRRNTIYTNDLSNITALKQGLAKVDEKLQTAHRNYANALANALIEAYRSLSEDEVNTQSYKAFIRDEGQFRTSFNAVNSTAVSNVKAALDAFERRVQNKANSDKK